MALNVVKRTYFLLQTILFDNKKMWCFGDLWSSMAFCSWSSFDYFMQYAPCH